ncbi:polysaccharide biosynthesis C-terminal domain-containing protein [Vannielia litorea]|uniref:Membrane protein involved in the export of O-antigen and teichoic acid n=1 Tax=Vannielia litorea TaxID=1217970 RepID=A0A1N6GWM8_9RHOB|nr:polysaccharide biosynthesis C-terminal domain-containing protein [Vannielia litorea]SIO11837.1 Membrane protein involved in the export of O-antigen and teichoic acid [Vannielia litorea]
MKRVLHLAATTTGKMALQSLAISLTSRIGQLAMTVLAARMLAPEGFGVFTFALGVGLVGGRLFGLGWPILMNRFVPKYRLAEDWPLLRGLVRAAGGVTLLAGLTGGLLCAALALVLGPESTLHTGLLLGGLLLPVMAFRSLFRNLLAALRTPQRGIVVDELLPAGLMTLMLLAFLGGQIDAEDATLLYVLASLVAVGAGGWWVLHRLPPQTGRAAPRYTLGRWMRTALPALVGSSARLLMNRTDILMIAPLATMAAVGHYGAAMRITYLQAAPVIVLSTVITARLSEAFAAGQVDRGKRLFFGSLAFAAAWTLPCALAFVVFDGEIMRLVFGAAYVEAAPILSVLAIAQVGAALNIPATSLMLMTGRQAAFGKMTLAALLLNIGGNLALIPPYGGLGAAIATAVSIIALTLMQLTSCAVILRSGRYAERDGQ